jgi:hypothetical protein
MWFDVEWVVAKWTIIIFLERKKVPICVKMKNEKQKNV